MRIDPESLRSALFRHFSSLGVEENAIRHVVTSLVETSLRGVDSHGIRLAPHYSRSVKSGRISRSPAFRVERKSASAALLAADDGFGHHAGSSATALAAEMARETGVGAVAVSGSTHFGAAGYFALPPARSGEFLAMAFTNADALVAPPSSRSAFFGTNPVCFAAPMAGEDPFCLDMATSRVAWNRILQHRRRDEPLEPGWAFDADGLPTTAPDAARMLAPAGDYKGYGLGMMVEILCGLLAGGPAATELLPMFTAPAEAKRNLSHFFVVIRIAAFTDPDRFAARLREMADALRVLPTVAGEVLVPGDPEKKRFVERNRDGIPVDPSDFAELVAVEPSVAGCLREPA